jgi:hypothetical protein
MNGALSFLAVDAAASLYVGCMKLLFFYLYTETSVEKSAAFSVHIMEPTHGPMIYEGK